MTLYIVQKWTPDTPPTPESLEQILDGAVEHRAWYHDNLWNAGPTVRRTVASSHLVAATRVWEVWRDDAICGIFLLNGWRPGLDAQVHFLFFDHQLINKRTLCRQMLAEVFEDDDLALHAVRVEVPEYAGRYVGFIRKALGFKYEAERSLGHRLSATALAKASRKHEAAYHKGKWHDVLLLSLTRDEFYEAKRRSQSQEPIRTHPTEQPAAQGSRGKPSGREHRAHSRDAGPDGGLSPELPAAGNERPVAGPVHVGVGESTELLREPGRESNTAT